MKAEIEDKNLDELLKSVIKSDEAPSMPISFVDRLTQKFEMRIVKRRLWEEWIFKMSIIIGITSCLAAIMFYTHHDIVSLWKVEYLYPILGLLIITFIFFFDQVILKWMFFISSQKKKHM